MRNEAQSSLTTGRKNMEKSGKFSSHILFVAGDACSVLE